MAAAKRKAKATPEAKPDLKKAHDQARAALPAIIKAAREDPAVFCQYVLKDELTGDPVYLADLHCEWHDLLSKNARVVIWSATDQGKTTQISVGRVLWEIGRKPNIRILLLCEAAEPAKKIIQTIRTYIETSVELREVFPNLKKGKLWQQAAITVQRSSKSKDPTVSAAGYKSKRVLGARFDLIIVDDYLSDTNTVTEKMREETYKWLKAIVEGRKTPDARLWFIGNAWHKRDAMHRYAKESHTVARRYSVMNDRDTITGQPANDNRKPQPRWPARWSAQRYALEVESRGRVEAMRSLDCIAADDSTEWVSEADVLPALRAGAGRELVAKLSYVPAGYRVISGVDPSSGEGADETAIVTIAVEPKAGQLGARQGRGRRIILDVRSGKWHGPRIVEQIADVHRKYQSIVFVESNGVQKWLKQFAKDADATIPIRSIHTGKNKTSPLHGVQSLAVEMAQGGWVIPNRDGEVDGVMHAEVKKLVTQLLGYSPDAHTGDSLMATWLAREGARKVGRVESGKQPKRRAA